MNLFKDNRIPTEEEIKNDILDKVKRSKKLRAKKYSKETRQDIVNLKKEYKELYDFFRKVKNKSLKEKFDYINNYDGYITNVYTKLSGQVSKDNYFSFLYDVENYVGYYFRNLL